MAHSQAEDPSYLKPIAERITHEFLVAKEVHPLLVQALEQYGTHEGPKRETTERRIIEDIPFVEGWCVDLYEHLPDEDTITTQHGTPLKNPISIELWLDTDSPVGTENYYVDDPRAQIAVGLNGFVNEITGESLRPEEIDGLRADIVDIILPNLARMRS